ncbi:helix-turn-helix transcriptional regulator [Pantoea ananatis]|uniref:helix-turn-helix transcriptional regulator n=1 Tax=Pantoea ananas TaxID=553 RepID=UPI000CF5577E|nr:helix-turn-helix transcriptional regulator [Pantoea ananatis]PQK90370.1 transcriptional regulator [Pantoea ananatis]PWV88941.1 helix-turn-helix protein [Pantoea ananatis]
MKKTSTPPRTRPKLEEFLRSKRATISPEEVGLTASSRRRTPGLRREEIAALAGVGVVWYTWLEQGRDISVSTSFLDNLSKVLKLDSTERNYLYLLAQQRLPAELGKTSSTVPPLILRLLKDLSYRPTYVLNLRWDILAWNKAAEALFNFSSHAEQDRNFLWLLFNDELYRKLMQPFDDQLVQMVNSFRRDYAKSPYDHEINALIERLNESSLLFRELWQSHDIYGPCSGIRDFYIKDIGPAKFDHYSLIVDDQKNIRMVYYAVQDANIDDKFKNWINRRCKTQIFA